MVGSFRNRQKTSKSETFWFILLSMLFLTFRFSSAEIHYVSTTGLSIPPYGNWESAADSIQKAIDVCNPGDTVVVANGTYHEYIYIDKTITLLGSSADSTVIDGSGTPDHVVEFFQNSSVMENFKIIGPGKEVPGIDGFYFWFSDKVTINKCRINDIYRAIINFNSSPTIENVFISDINYAISEFMVYDTCRSVYRNNVIISTGGTQTPVQLEWAYPTFINNILIEEGEIWRGIYISAPRGCIIKNNLISGYRTEAVLVGSVRTDTAYIINNTLVYNSMDTMFAYASIATGTGLRTQIKNNIIAHTPRGIHAYNSGIAKAHYNLFWDVTRLTGGNAALGDSNIIADPMFVNDTKPTSEMLFNLMLQKYSPGIDHGDISILDKDGSRSDMGMFGGPGGEEYTYLDLAPRAPVNLTAVVTSDSIKLKWNRNSEADTAYYKVYRDTVQNFTIDSTKLIASVTNPFFNESVPIDSGHLYYKITAVDLSNHESNPSEEVHIQITSTTGTEEPYLISSYNLYQNYPNPFNPTTKIGYRLTERGYVKLIIYDIKGELLKVLINKEQESGYYEIEFNGQDYSSQILLYRLEIIGQGGIPVYSDMKKAVLLK